MRVRGQISALALMLAALAAPASAYVSGTASAVPGGYDAELGVNFERGLLGAQDVPESQQQQTASITEYHLKFGHNFGEVGGLQDFSLRLSGIYYLAAPESLGGVILYPSDEGTILGLEVAANFVHEPTRIVGGFFRLAAPFSMIVEKFQKPRIDTYAMGVQSGFEISNLLGWESLLYFGGGLVRGGVRYQNASLIASSLLSARWRGVVANGLTLKAGPFFESDVTERSDAQYGTTAFRGYRVGLTGIGSIQLSSSMGLEVGYVQKLSGAFFRATKDLFIATKFVF